MNDSKQNDPIKNRIHSLELRIKTLEEQYASISESQDLKRKKTVSSPKNEQKMRSTSPLRSGETKKRKVPFNDLEKNLLTISLILSANSCGSKMIDHDSKKVPFGFLIPRSSCYLKPKQDILNKKANEMSQGFFVCVYDPNASIASSSVPTSFHFMNNVTIIHSRGIDSEMFVNCQKKMIVVLALDSILTIDAQSIPESSIVLSTKPKTETFYDEQSQTYHQRFKKLLKDQKLLVANFPNMINDPFMLVRHLCTFAEKNTSLSHSSILNELNIFRNTFEQDILDGIVAIYSPILASTMTFFLKRMSDLPHFIKQKKAIQSLISDISFDEKSTLHHHNLTNQFPWTQIWETKTVNHRSLHDFIFTHDPDYLPGQNETARFQSPNILQKIFSPQSPTLEAKKFIFVRASLFKELLLRKDFAKDYEITKQQIQFASLGRIVDTKMYPPFDLSLFSQTLVQYMNLKPLFQFSSESVKTLKTVDTTKDDDSYHSEGDDSNDDFDYPEPEPLMEDEDEAPVSSKTQTHPTYESEDEEFNDIQVQVGEGDDEGEPLDCFQDY